MHNINEENPIMTTPNSLSDLFFLGVIFLVVYMVLNTWVSSNIKMSEMNNSLKEIKSYLIDNQKEVFKLEIDLIKVNGKLDLVIDRTRKN